MTAKELTQAELKEHFKYEDGVLWRKTRCKYWKVVENKAHNQGYCLVRFNDRLQRYHRIVYTLVNGDIPEGLELDHMDGCRINNKLSNLRLVSHRQNCQNTHRHREGHLLGTTFNKQKGKWNAHIKINGKQIHIGYFATQQEAHEAYLSAVANISLSVPKHPLPPKFLSI